MKSIGGQLAAIGKRKTACARVFLKPGSGTISVNGLSPLKYFGSESLVHTALYPLKLLQLENAFDIKATIKGSGKSAQAEALRLATARAIVEYQPETRKMIKSARLLTRDARKVERKKYGLHKARKATQYSKR